MAGTIPQPQNGDFFIATDDNGVTYKIDFYDGRDIILPSKHILHIKNISLSSVKPIDFEYITDISGNRTDKTEFSSGEWLIYGENARFKPCTANWDFGAQTYTKERKNFGDFLKECSKFNGDISHLEIDSATDVSYMFSKCSKFNQPVDHFNTGQVRTMRAFFQSCSEFNQPLNHFDTSLCEIFMIVVQKCAKWNQPVDKWDTSQGRQFNGIFDGTKFTGDISNWDVSNATSFRTMFQNCPFNGDISNWDVRRVTDTSYMFSGNKSFNQDISKWQWGAWESAEAMFINANAFNQDISEWNTSKLTKAGMEKMFNNAKAFNQDLSQWCVSQVSSKPLYFDYGASKWKTSRPIWGTCPRGEDATP